MGVITMNQVPKMQAGTQNASKPFQANGLDLKNVTIPPGRNSKATQKFKYPSQRGKTGTLF
jgi:hypothetical protein